MIRKSEVFPFPLDGGVIVQRRAVILGRLIAADEAFCSIPVQGISPQTLERMFSLYDELFFGGILKRMSIQVTLSSRLTSSAGKFVFARGPFGRIKQAEIRMSSDFLLRLDQGPFELNGLNVATPQEAFLLVFEHELCHAAETLLYGNTGHSARFLSLANGLFGHTATRHKLPTRRMQAARSGLTIGAQATFSVRNRELTGTITYIGKMATVMVPSVTGEYRDRHEKRYTKYRVPLTKLSIQ